MNENKILVIDIETTGFLENNGFIVEIGMVELNLDNGKRRIVMSQVCHETGITKEDCDNSWIVKNSSLTTQDIRYSPNLDKVRSEVQYRIDDYPRGSAAYNCSFDFGFLKDRGFNIPIELPDPMLLMTDVCKLKRYGKNVSNKYKWPKVEEAYSYLFPESNYKELHRGADDALHEAEIIFEMYQRKLIEL